MVTYCVKEAYTNTACLKLKEELLDSVGGSYTSNCIYITKGQEWYINQRGYVHFIKGVNDVLLTNDFTLKY
ncbi:hypothetical protein [Lacrimispora sp.]|uniref:hypothetical protein n=1 Tax=Lacrimispora sp. TaxID=2719234 RepID=UPI0028AA4B13|nr:hypothetical protein [Lacrimispora sp.]